MASISKLSIRGIRAFSPDDEEQVINFYNPLTIIVGANGCGKTTIIESLKYAVCGSLPPGNKSGQAFVHDPKSVGQSSVKANIKLRFTNRAGNSMVVVRSAEVTQKRTNLTFKALDGILRTTDPETGERVSLSHKCTELDRQIPTLMGVSKPILESVVFCHQEDSSWPLMEGSVLKKRFDDIFDSTRYAKALEAIRKSRLEYQGIAKDHKVELASLASHRHAAEGFRDELEGARDELGRIDEALNGHAARVEEETAKRDEYASRLSEIADLRDRRDGLRSDLERDETIAASNRSLLEDDWTQSHTGDQLRSMMSGFDDVIREDLRHRDECQAKVLQAQRDIERLREQTVALNGQMGKLGAEAEAHDSVLRQRVKLVEEMATRYGLTVPGSQGTGSGGGGATGPSQGTHGTRGDAGIGTQQSAVSAVSAATGATGGAGGRQSLASGASGAILSQDTFTTLTAEDMVEVMRAVEERGARLKEELERHRAACQREEDTVQEVLGDLQARMRSVESERHRLAVKKNDAQSELSRIHLHGSGHSRMRKSDIEEARRQAAKYAKDRDELNKDPRKGVIPKEIKANEERIDSLKRIIEDDGIALRDLRQGADNQAAIDMLRHQVAQDAENLEDAIRENSFLLQKHSVQPNTAGFSTNHDGVDRMAEEMKKLADAAREKHEAAKHDLSRAEEEAHASQRAASEKGALVQHGRRSLERLRAQAEELSAADRGVQRIRKVTNAVIQFERAEGGTIAANVDPQELLKHLSDKAKEYSTEESPDTISRTIKKLRRMARQFDDAGVNTHVLCPCCLRDMDPPEAQRFADNMKELEDPSRSVLFQAGRNAGRNRAAKTNYERWHGSVQQSMQDYLDYNRIAGELEATETSVRDGEEDLKRLQSGLDAAKDKLDRLRAETAELRQVLEVANRLSDDADRMSGKCNQIQTKEDELNMVAPSSNGRDLKTVEREIQARMDEKDNLTQNITKLNKELSALNEQISRVTNQAAKAEQMVRDKEKKFAQEQEASVKKTELNELISNCNQEEKKLVEQLAPLRQKIKAKDSEKQRMRAAAKAEEDRLNDNLNHFNADVRKLNDLTTRIDRYEKSNKQEELDKITQDLCDTADRQDEKEKALGAMSPELEALNKKVNDQERHKKTIQGNIELLDVLEKIKSKKERLSLLEEEIDAVEGSDTSERDYQATMKRIQQHENARAQCEGRRAGVKDQIKMLKRKLQTAEYRDIDERHRQQMIKYETTNIAVSDLDKYYSALDKALLRYHGMKIEDINKIIRELWTLTYKGEDITNIQIASNQDSGSKAAKSYNYRVVMTKGSAQLDMRGRCSAGQRVLASIVIRLALAETFCLNCGVMCLDEPTTNLDYANKRGLAIALAQIIATRAAQANFQLVVITHDEEFVTMMKNELTAHTGFDMPERYFQVSREEGNDGKHYSKIHAIDWDEL